MLIAPQLRGSSKAGLPQHFPPMNETSRKFLPVMLMVQKVELADNGSKRKPAEILSWISPQYSLSISMRNYLSPINQLEICLTRRSCWVSHTGSHRVSLTIHEQWAFCSEAKCTMPNPARFWFQCIQS